MRHDIELSIKIIVNLEEIEEIMEVNDLVKIKLENCNSILNGVISIEKNILNIKYAANGAGKSTIADAIKYFLEEKDMKLKALKSFGSEIDPKVTICVVDDNGVERCEPSIFSTIEIFNEDFVKDVVFKESEAITQSFDVFIKTPDFEAKRKSLDERLKGLKIDIAEDASIKEMRRVFDEIVRKILFNVNGSIAKKGMGKDVINKNNAYNLPQELQKFGDFFQCDNRVNWVDWKSKGHVFDDKNKCPFCAEPLKLEVYKNEKKVFESTYSKAMIKNQKDLEEYLVALKPFINDIDYKRIYGLAREFTNEKDFEAEFRRFLDEVKLVNRKISEVIGFDSYGIEREDIDNLNRKISGFVISIDSIKIFNSDKAKNVFELINRQINSLLLDVSVLKGDIAKLNSHIEKAIDNSKTDINKFLKSAGINYEFNIVPSSEKTSKAELKYIGNGGNYFEVSNIRQHLSWGERNSIALILFMYSALQKNADLIILDDPISSFDKNKKYAIMSRLFKKGIEKSFLHKTVLFLTHDFEPVIDLRTKKRFANKLAKAHFLVNKNGQLNEAEISDTDIKSITVMYSEDIKDEGLNIINRVASFRKYLEYVNKDYLNNDAYNILTSLMKGRKNVTIKNEDNSQIILDEAQLENGRNEIKDYINDFNYDELLSKEFTKETIIKCYKKEENSFLKVQVFRQLYILEENDIKIDDEILKKFADESFHIENDYTHCLNYKKFDIVPPYIMEKIESFMNEQ